MADLNVSTERITYAERVNQNITKLTDAAVEALASREKEVVVANAAKANNADVIVAPTINITTDVNKNLVIVVTGYPATYKNFRNVTDADKWIIDNANAAQDKSGEKKANPLVRLHIPMYLYAGVGYGYRGLFYETTDHEWVAWHTANTIYHGMHWEAGLMGNIKGFAISQGVSSITDFSNMYYEEKLG